MTSRRASTASRVSWWRPWGVWIPLVALAISACATRPTGSGSVASDLHALAVAFFADPPLEYVRLSPDGERLVFLASRDGVRAVAEKPVEGGRPNYLGRFGATENRVHDLGWAGDGAVVLALEVRETDHPLRRVVMLAFHPSPWRPARTTEPWVLNTSPRAIGSGILSWLPEDPEQILATTFDATRNAAAAKRFRVRTGTSTDVSPQMEGVQRWFADAEDRLRAAVVFDPEALAEAPYARVDESAPLEVLRDVGLEEEEHLAFAGFSPDPSQVYVYATSEAGRRGVYTYSLPNRARSGVVVEHPTYDAGDLLYAPGGGALRAVEIPGERPELVFVDPAAEREQLAIDAVFPNTSNRLVASDRNGLRTLLEVSGDTAPPRVFVFERERKELTLLYDAHPGLEGRPLGPMRPVTYPTRDGDRIHAYLTLPPGVGPEAGPRLPTIVIPHDGPTDRDVWGWNARVQFLAARGFAVLQPNYRGSDGYGRAFERQGYGEWGGLMQTDLADGVAWLVEQGVTDPERVGIFGEGYGGYAALMAPIATPGVFRAAAGWGAITDLPRLVAEPGADGASDPNHPVFWSSPRDPERLVQASPARRAAEMLTPVLLGHAAADRRVPVAQSRALADALSELPHALPVALHVYRDDDETLSVEAHRIDFHERLAAFFEQHLGRGDG